MSCFTERISADIAIDCENLAIGGVEDDVVIIPHDEVDKTASYPFYLGITFTFVRLARYLRLALG